MTKNNSKNWLEIEDEYINNIVGCRINDLKSRDLRQVAEDTLAFFKPYFQEKMHEEAVELAELEASQNFIAGYNKGVDIQLYWRHMSEEEQKEILHKQFGYDICQWENCSGGRYCEKHSLETVDNNPKE